MLDLGDYVSNSLHYSKEIDVTNWSDLVEKHGPLVWQTVRRLVSHNADAADCFQEVFMAAFQMSQKDKILSWSATLRHLATVKSMDCLRRRYRNDSSKETAHPPDLVDTRWQGADQTIAEGELASALRSALSTLDPKQAEVFCMVCLEAMSYQETADTIGINVNHVGVLLHRARTELRTLLKSHAPSPTNVSQKGVNSNATQS